MNRFAFVLACAVISSAAFAQQNPDLNVTANVYNLGGVAALAETSAPNLTSIPSGEAGIYVDPPNDPSCMNGDGSLCASTFCGSGSPAKMGCRLAMVNGQVTAACGCRQ